MLLIALSMLLCLLVGFMNVGTDSCDLSITTITQKLFCSSVENLTVHLPPTVPLQPSPPVPVVHATLLAKENAPACKFLLHLIS